MKKLGLVLLVLSLCACTRFSMQGERLYATSQSAPPLIVPAPLIASNLSDFYSLPPQNEDPCVSVVPPKEPIHEES